MTLREGTLLLIMPTPELRRKLRLSCRILGLVLEDFGISCCGLSFTEGLSSATRSVLYVFLCFSPLFTVYQSGVVGRGKYITI